MSATKTEALVGTFDDTTQWGAHHIRKSWPEMIPFMRFMVPEWVAEELYSTGEYEFRYPNGRNEPFEVWHVGKNEAK